VDYYKITATEKMIDDQIGEIRHRAAHQEHHDHDHEHEHEHEYENDQKEIEEHDHETLPALDEDFFSKVFPGAEIKDEATFRLKIKEAIEHSLAKESERFFMNSAVEALVNGINIELPDVFLKKAMHENNENKLSEEEIENQYENFARSVRWQLIESRLIQEKGLHVEEHEMRDVVKNYFTGHMANTEVNEEQDERLNKIVDSVLSNKEESNRLYDQLYDQKLLAFFKSGLMLENKEVDYDSFVKIITKKTE
jgi:trigger factor